MGLDPKKKLFSVPKSLVRCLNRDLAAAGISKVDDRGRTVDVHALRHTFGTLLSKGGVAPRTAQQAMRHSDIRLTMKTYTDPRLLDVAGAVESLPALSFETITTTSLRQNGTVCDAPTVAPNTFKTGQIESNFDNAGSVEMSDEKQKNLVSLRKTRVFFNRGDRI